MTELEIVVPEGISEGMEFTVEYEGTQLAVICPAGCQPGDLINLTFDVPAPRTCLR